MNLEVNMNKIPDNFTNKDYQQVSVQKDIYTKVKTCFFLIFLLLAVPLLIQAGSPTSKNSPTKVYISKDYVDTSIQRAFYLLNEAASIAGVGFKQKETIDEAKAIARNLRQRAKGDKNEKYIIWKISELEAQIYLEEKDILLMQMQQGQQSVNQLVARYNAEVGKSRPDFASMRRLHVQMGRLDNAKANQMANSYNQRYRSISREAVANINKSIDDGNLEKAREELGYCLRNASYLSISTSTYSNLEEKVEKLTTACNEKPIIEEETRTAFMALEKNDFFTARENLSRADNRLILIRKYLPENESITLAAQIGRGNKKLTFKEDSLITLNLSILSQKGVAAADDFLRKTLMPMGVSVEKTALVDKAILGIKTPEDTKMSDEIGSLSSGGSTDEAQSAILDEIIAKAKKKAQEKADSLQKIEQATLRVAIAEQQRQDSIAEIIKAAELEKFQKNQKTAQSISLDIYSSLEKNIKAAHKKFNKERPYLLNYLDKEEFYILESTLQQFSMTPVVETKQQENSIPNLVLNESSDQKQEHVETNYSEPLPKAIEEILQKNQMRAEEEISLIYSMLEKNQIDDAYARFQKIRKPLEMFLQKDIFTMLQSTISQAWEFQKNVSSDK